MKHWILTVFVIVSFLTVGCDEKHNKEEFEFYFPDGDTYTMKVGDELVLECVLLVGMYHPNNDGFLGTSIGGSYDLKTGFYYEIFWLSSKTRVAIVERLTPVNANYPSASDRVDEYRYRATALVTARQVGETVITAVMQGNKGKITCTVRVVE